MKRQLLTATVLTLAQCLSSNADTVGAAGPLQQAESVDGWSGITTLEGDAYGTVGAGQSVSAYSYYADGNRADGTRSVQGLVVQKDTAGVASIWDIGPVHTPSVGGEYTVDWAGAKTVPADGNTYHAGFWQWAAGVDDTDGGLVPFANAGGSGMFQSNRNPIDPDNFVPEVGHVLDAGHASGADGRAYQFNLSTVPEPASIVLALIAGFGLTRVIRRKK